MSKIKTFIIELLRNGHIESTYQVEMTTNKSEGQKFFPRSAIKPFQIKPLIKLANESNTNLTKEEIAIFGSSHSGQDIHTDLLLNICKKYEVPVPAAAIQFCYTNKLVTSMILGMDRVEQVKQNLDYLNFPIPEDLWKDLLNEKLIDERCPI